MKSSTDDLTKQEKGNLLMVNLKKLNGRPTKMTNLLVKKLEEAFSLGASDAEACFYAGISKQTLYDFEKKNPKFSDRKTQLKERPILLARQTVIKGIQKDPDLALKFLERRKKEEFSLRQEVEHSSPNISPLVVIHAGRNPYTTEEGKKVLPPSLKS